MGYYMIPSNIDKSNMRINDYYEFLSYFKIIKFEFAFIHRVTGYQVLSYFTFMHLVNFMLD